MSDRRRLLMAISNTGKWLPYSFEYLYHDLIPTTISGKNVKNKLKLATIYGNSVVENQLCNTSLYQTSTTINGITRDYDASTRRFHIYGLATANANIQLSNGSIDIIANRYYLLKGLKTTGTINTIDLRFSGSLHNYYDLGNGNVFKSISNESGTIRVYVASGQNVDFYIDDPIFTDLTQEYPFDTPTTLTDNRVQAILNRGYIPHNSGELKSVDIGEFSSEPYNLFDEEWRQGDINQTTGELYNTGNNIRSTNLNSVIGGQTYTFEWDRTSCNAAVGGYTYLYIYEYDKNGNYIYFNDTDHSGITSATKQLTLTSETAGVRVKIYSSGTPAYSSLTKDIIKLCVHRTGTRTGYAPHTQPQTISFKYQGSGAGTSHNTMEIGKENVVFTKNIGSVDLSTLSFSFNSTYKLWLGSLTTIKSFAVSELPNILSNKYQTILYNEALFNAKYGIGVNTQLLGVYKDSSDDGTTPPSGTLEYQLATPQVITIPRKHMLLVNLGEQNIYSENLSSGVNYYTDIISNAKQTSNCYCSKYLSNASSSGSIRNNIWVSSSKRINCTADGFNSIDEFKSAMMGVYVAIETTTEVADIIDTIGVESGGTFTSDSEVLPNVDTKIKCK